MVLRRAEQAVQVLTTRERLQPSTRALIELGQSRRGFERGNHSCMRRRHILLVGLISIHAVSVRPRACQVASVAFRRLERMCGEGIHERSHQLEVCFERLRGKLRVARRCEHNEVSDHVYLGFGLCKGGIGNHGGDRRDD